MASSSLNGLQSGVVNDETPELAYHSAAPIGYQNHMPALPPKPHNDEIRCDATHPDMGMTQSRIMSRVRIK